MSACLHDWIETAEYETGDAYELCLLCGDDRPVQSTPYTEQETTK